MMHSRRCSAPAHQPPVSIRPVLLPVFLEFWAAVARRIRSGKRRNTFLSQFGPLSFLVLISLWASG